jgi:hypothetical protein
MWRARPLAVAHRPAEEASVRIMAASDGRRSNIAELG